ncbi:hypothetical protein JCM3770_001452 [Rhodotorula araucariae]
MRRARPFHPPATREAYKDLLIFEERLKQNAERLQKQRRKYEAFLFSLVGVSAYLAYVVFVLPSIYSLVHYGNVAMLLVAVTTLVLFFATGMYSEKIAYAHKFVPQANRALRPFNIYLNTRHRSRFSLFRLFSSPAPPSTTLSRTPSGQSMNSQGSAPPLLRSPSACSASSASLRSAGAWRSPSTSPPLSPSAFPPASPPTHNDPVTRALPSSPSSSGGGGGARGIPLPPIPPAQNPRGELIFSSRVSPQFREGYERYRGEWERRRAEAKRVQRERDGRWTAWVRRAWWRGEAVHGRGQRDEKRGGGEFDRDGSLEPPSHLVGAAMLEPREPRNLAPQHAPNLASSGGGDFEIRSPARAAGSRLPSPEPAVLSSTSTPASSRSPSPARAPAPLARRATPPSASSSLGGGGDSPGRIRAESFSDLLTFDAKSESGALRSPGLERSNSMRGGG